MRKRQINPLLLMGFIGILTIGTRFTAELYRAYWGNDSIWWTHQQMRLPVEDSGNSFILYIAGKPLQGHLDEGSLFAAAADGQKFRVVAGDVGVRLNNWYRVKASILTWALISAFAFGCSVTLFVTGLIQYLTRKKSPE